MIAALIRPGEISRIALAFLPVLVFLAALRGLDSYKLASGRKVFTALAAGGAAAALCFVFNTFMFHRFPGDQDSYARFGAPVVEELAKGVWWIFLIATARVAFLVDSGICAFAVGAGFALVENVSLLDALQGQGVGIWILRGFGTAIMHGGVAALGAIASEWLSEVRRWSGAKLFVPGLLAAMILHSAFNQSLNHPLAATLAAVAGLPPLLFLAFYLSERSLRNWLGGKLDSDIDMLGMLTSEEFQQTAPGVYLNSLQGAFPPEVRGDMLSCLHLNLELSARVKGELMLREMGVPVLPDPELDSRLKELHYLEKSIGPTGMLALRPLLSRSPRDLWELHRLKEGSP